MAAVIVAADVIVLSSSPSRSLIATTPPPGSTALMSSSPRLPSPSQLMIPKRLGHLIGSRATPRPLGALKGFASAASPLRTAGAAGPDHNVGTSGKLGMGAPFEIQSGGWERALSMEYDIGQRATKATAKKPRAPRKKAPTDRGEASVIPSRPNTIAEPDMSKPAAVKKPRARKSKDGLQRTIKKGKVTKPATTGDSVQPGKVKGSARSKTLKPIVKKSGPDAKVEDVSPTRDVVPLRLDEATRRKKDWTPARDTVPTATEFAAPKELPTFMHDSAQAVVDDAPSRDLTGLLSNYNYPHGNADAISDPTRLRTSEGEGLSKKRRIELIDTISCPPLPPTTAKKSKVPKKKPQTITEKATAPFIVEDTAAAPTLLQYFPASALNADAGNGNEDFQNLQQPSRPARRKSSAKTPSKAKSKTTASKKQTSKAPTLLSPESALKNARNQDLLFGTSSQLAREESPTFIRDLQQAIKASESMEEPVSFTDSGSDVASAMSGSSTGMGISLHVASRNLWSVAARDTQGSLLDAEVVNLLDEGKAPAPLVEDIDQPELRIPVEEILNPATTTQKLKLESFISLPDEDELQKQDNRSIVVPSLCLQPSIPKSVAEAALCQRTRSRSPVKKTSKSKTKKGDQPQKPDYQGFTVSKLAKEIASYGFKPAKNREQMITLLERCWEGKARMALQSLPPNANVPTVGPVGTDEISAKAPSPPKRKAKPAVIKAAPTDTNEGEAPPLKPRRRPRKPPARSAAGDPPPKTTSEKAAITADAFPPRPRTPTKAKRKTATALPDEISDSDSPLTPSPPRRASHTTPKPLPLTSPHLSQPTPHLTPGAARQHLFSKITEAITTAPPTHDPKNLTWFEKIILYDPIVLEHLTTWLNTEGLARVGVDEEVGALVVREWCEGKGVCCLWRENFRRGARAMGHTVCRARGGSRVRE